MKQLTLKKKYITFLIMQYRRSQALRLSELFTTAVIASRLVRQIWMTATWIHPIAKWPDKTAGEIERQPCRHNNDYWKNLSHVWLNETTETLHASCGFVTQPTHMFISVLFGTTCSSFILNATILAHLQCYKSCIDRKNFYVDNIRLSL